MARGDPGAQVPAGLASALAEAITEADVEKAVATLRDGLSAKTTARKGGGQYHMVEDWRTRIVAAKILLEFGAGKPAQRVEHSGHVGHIHATPEEILAMASRVGRVGPTGKIVQEYLNDRGCEAIDIDDSRRP